MAVGLHDAHSHNFQTLHRQRYVVNDQLPQPPQPQDTPRKPWPSLVKLTRNDNAMWSNYLLLG